MIYVNLLILLLVIEVFLIVTVWRNAHWSVAVILTFQFLRGVGMMVRGAAERLKASK